MKTTFEDPKMFVYKDKAYGWKAESEFELQGGHILRVFTRKTFNGDLVTSAIVGRNDGGFFTYMMYQDYSRELLSVKTRVTDKSVEAQQMAAFKMLPEVLKEIEAKYGSVKETGTSNS